jgi:uncharacterized membrane protein YjjP (DUF1212 family)
MMISHVHGFMINGFMRNHFQQEQLYPDGFAQSLSGLLLATGKALMASGMPTQRAYDTLVEMARRLGANDVEVVISYEGLWVTIEAEGQKALGMAALPEFGVDFQKGILITQLCYQLQKEKLTILEVQEKLDAILALGSMGLWKGALLSGVGCAAVGQIFGGDLGAIGVVFLAASVGCGLWLFLMRPSFSLYAATVLAASLGGTIAGIGGLLGWTETPSMAVSASMLYLVPGVPMICGFLDILFGQVSVGVARLVHMVFASLAIAVGLWASIHMLILFDFLKEI